MSPLSKVEMSPSTQFEVPAIPSCSIILHRVQPSRLPSGAQDAALTAPVRDAQGYSQMREWRALFWLFRARGDISTLPARGTFLLCRDIAWHRVDTLPPSLIGSRRYAWDN